MAKYKNNDYSSEFISSIDNEKEILLNNAEKLSTKAIDDREKAKSGIDSQVSEKKRIFSGLYEQLYNTPDFSVIHKPTYYFKNDVNADSYPELYISPNMPTASDILLEAENRTILDNLLVGETELIGKLGKKLFPKYIEWQSTNETHPGNFYISFNENQRRESIDFTNDMLMRMLMAFAPGNIIFSFVDPLLSGNASFFEKSLADVPELFYNKVFSSNEDIKKHIEFLTGRMEFISRTLPPNTSATAHYKAQNKIENSYHVLVIYDVINLRSVLGLDLLKPLILNGNKFGIYVVFVQPNINNATDSKMLSDMLDSPSIIKIEKEEGPDKLFKIANDNLKFKHITSLGDNNPGVMINSTNLTSPLIQTYFGSLKDILKKKKEESKLSFTYEDYGNQKYNKSYTEFIVPIGEAEGRLFNFNLNVKDHVHTFALGRTGSGKSVLLNAILTAAVLKYSPDSLQLYLMDFKEGGPEFKAYEGLPHVRALLTDNTDIQIVLEILQDIRKKMVERGELIAQYGGETKNIEHYNEVAEVKLPRIVLAIDECHLLFSIPNAKIQEQINTIISYIATQGRSQGIHLLFGTQTATRLSMPDNVLNNLTDFFVLRSTEMDAMRFLGNNTKLLSQITKPGQSIYRHNESTTLLQPFLVEKDYLVKLVNIANEKANEYVKNNNLRLDDSVVFGGGVKPSLLDVDKEKITDAALLGLEVSMKKEQYVSVPLQKRINGTNLLVVGNKEELEGQSEENAMRVCISSIMSTVTYYKRENKDFSIYVINRFEEDATQSKILNKLAQDETNYLTILERRTDIESFFNKLLHRINSESDEQEEIYLYILGQHLFRELRRNEAIKTFDADIKANNSEKNSFDLPIAGGGLDVIFNSASDNGSGNKEKQATYKSVLNNILIEGPEKGIHTIIQISKLDDLLFEGAQRATLGHFGYYVLLAMSNYDSEKITENRDITTENLSSDPKRVRAYLYNDMNSKNTLFVPFVLPDK